MREGLVTLLEDEPDLKVVGQASSGREAIDSIRQHQPDIVLLDIMMDDMTGLEALRQISAEMPHIRVLILTMHTEEVFFFEALQAGASGYVLKDAYTEELFIAIRSVYQGGIYIPPKLAGRVTQYYVNSYPPTLLVEPLTLRERDILDLIFEGLTNIEIAQQLTISLNTIKTHRRHIYEKLNLHDRAGLVKYAFNSHGFGRS